MKNASKDVIPTHAKATVNMATTTFKKTSIKKKGDNYGLVFHAKNTPNVLKMQKSTFNITDGQLSWKLRSACK